MSDDVKLVVLREAATPFEAEFIVGALRNAGIEAHSEETAHISDPVQAATGEGIKIYVPDGQLEQAQAILKDIGEEPQA